MNGRWLHRLPVRERYKPISGYGVIGNTRTAALVGYDGSVDWCCLPRFDSPSIFAAILDRDVGGRWEVTPEEKAISEQRYVKDTNVLQTKFETEGGLTTLTDFMPCHEAKAWGTPPEIHRLAECRRGEMSLRVWLQPMFDYGRARARVSGVGQGFLFENAKEEMVFSSSAGTFRIQGGVVEGKVRLKGGERAMMVLSYGESVPRESSEYSTDRQLARTKRYWRRWASRLKYKGRWKEQVVRSALALRLLVYSPTGAIIAAPTASLPEAVGFERNWDYRYSWIRDSSFSLWAFHLLGSASEAEHYIHWLIDNNPALDKDLRLMYTVDGGTRLPEGKLKHLEGYMRSAPVRIGNAASTQLQLDAHGSVLDALYFSTKYGSGVTEETYYRFVKPLANFICDNWRKKGNGIWEIRGKREHYVYTKAWCYVGLKRACKIAELTGHERDTERWRRVMQEIRHEVMVRGWNEEGHHFVMSYGRKDLDASLLVLPLIGFVREKDGRMRETVEAIRKQLSENGLLFRYRIRDGLEGKEGSFTICNFWMVALLARMGRLKEAEELMKRVVELGGPLWLYSEELDPGTGSMLGNYPQAFSHMGLITAAFELDAATKKGGR